ncbi:MAG: hypothetical protein IRZ17_02370 [Mycolicibacterium hassiacum]|uniref:DUF6092 family protein n=1 Tax=Mycolicibacterium hassiacum TaxID=46351 RepID=UPI0023F9736D|nr:DUF6092 family protein [Mycolicibacterium hassiacum]MBX5485436.1 hypothetical protein [Mycolicibacterium hassiacum]
MASDDEVFGAVAFLVASARDTVEATAAYGAFRLLDAAGRLAALAPDDAFLERVAREIEERKHLIMSDAAAFTAAIDSVLADVAGEAKRRNGAS